MCSTQFTRTELQSQFELRKNFVRLDLSMQIIITIQKFSWRNNGFTVKPIRVFNLQASGSIEVNAHEELQK